MLLSSKTDRVVQVPPLALYAFVVTFYFFSNLLQVLPNVIRTELVGTFALSGEQFGQLVAVCLYVYSIMQLPMGYVVDRFGLRHWVALSCIIFAFGCFCFSIAESIVMANIGRVLIGFGGALSFVSCMKIISMHFTSTTASFLTGLTASIGFSGAVFALATTSWFLEFIDWRNLVETLSYICFALALIILFVTRNEGPFVSGSTESSAPVGPFDDLKCLLKQSETWLASFYAALMFVPTQVFGTSWGVTFLMEDYPYDRAVAGMYSSLIYVGWIIGAPLWGYLAGHFQEYYKIMMLCTILTFVFCLTLIYHEPLPYNSVSLVIFAIGFFSSAYILIFAVMIKIMSPRLSGTILGIISMVTGLSALFIPLVGFLLDQLATNLKEYNVNGDAFEIALTVVPAALLVALPLLWRLALLTKRKGTFCS